MSESLSNRPNFPLFIEDHNYARVGIHAALTELKTEADTDKVRLAAEQLIQYQKRLPETYAQVATAYIDAGQIDSWLDDFVYEDERAIYRMLEDAHTVNTYGDDELTGNMFFSQMPREEMYRLAYEHFTGVVEPQSVSSIDRYVAPEFTGSRALKYEYEFRVNNAINNFIETLPEPVQIVVAQENEIYNFRGMLDQVESPLEYKDAFGEDLSDDQLVIRLLRSKLENRELSNIIAEYEDAKTAFATTLEEISQTDTVKVLKRQSLYRDVQANVNVLTFQFNHLCDTISDKYSDKRVAARIMAALWRMDKEMLSAIVNSLSKGQDEYHGMIDPAIGVYAEYFMGIEPRDKNLELSRQNVIGYYTYALDTVVEKVKNIQ